MTPNIDPKPKSQGLGYLDYEGAGQSDLEVGTDVASNELWFCSALSS